MSSHPLAGRTRPDAGARTGTAGSALIARRARVPAMDLPADMLAWNAAIRPPCAVADICTLPPATETVDDSVAAFALNHLTDPVPGLGELGLSPGPAAKQPIRDDMRPHRPVVVVLSASGPRRPAGPATLPSTSTPGPESGGNGPGLAG